MLIGTFVFAQYCFSYLLLMVLKGNSIPNDSFLSPFPEKLLRAQKLEQKA